MLINWYIINHSKLYCMLCKSSFNQTHIPPHFFSAFFTQLFVYFNWIKSVKLEKTDYVVVAGVVNSCDTLTWIDITVKEGGKSVKWKIFHKKEIHKCYDHLDIIVQGRSLGYEQVKRPVDINAYVGGYS